MAAVSETTSRPLRVLHLVSSEGVTGAAQQSLFMPMLTRMPKQRVKMQVFSLSPNAVPAAVLRQNGVPVYDIALSKHRFSSSSFGQLLKAARTFRPDVIQAWGHTAQIVSKWLRGRCDWEMRVVWSVCNTQPLSRKAGTIDRQKLKYAAKFSSQADRIVYTSEAAASAHRRVGFPEAGHAVIPLGVDPTRFKPDFAVRRKVREQLGLSPEAFVIGMMAPFQPEYDHATLFKAIGDLIKTNPNIAILLAGHGIQKGNGPLMALVGGGTLGTRTQLLGEWSDVSSFFNACDIACSSALTDNGRMSLVTAMLCGVPCVATGMGAQGEVIGQYGVAVEPGSPAALIRGITRVMQLPPDKRAFMATGARKHALTNFVSVRSLQKYLQLYFDLIGREVAASTAVPVPEIDATVTAPTESDKAAAAAAPKPKANRTVEMYDLADPDSLESRDVPTPEERAENRKQEGDVLHLFETNMAQQAASGQSPMSERARGVADELEDLLTPEALNASGLPTMPLESTPVAAPEAAVKAIAPGWPKVAQEPKAEHKSVPASANNIAAPVPALTGATSAAPPPPRIDMSINATTERARGVPEEIEDLLSPESLQSIAPAEAKPPVAPSGAIVAASVPPVVVTKESSVVEAAMVETLAPPTVVNQFSGVIEVAPRATESATTPITQTIEPVLPVVPAMPAHVARLLMQDIKPVAVPSVAQDAATDEETISADSATVPALAIDALLSAARDDSNNLAVCETATAESLQLDFLSEHPSDQQRIVG